MQVPLVDVEGGNLPIVVSVTASVTAPMQTEEQLSTCNLLTITVDGLFAVPEQWSVTPQGTCRRSQRAWVLTVAQASRPA